MDFRIPLYKLKLVRERWVVCDFLCVDSPQIAALFLYRLIGQADREHSAALFLDVHRKPTGASILGIGSLTSAEMPAREVFKAALLANAHQVIVAHNHPSGDPDPSAADLALTRRLTEAGKLLGIPLFDHIIVSPNGSFASLREGALDDGQSYAPPVS